MILEKLQLGFNVSGITVFIIAWIISTLIIIMLEDYNFFVNFIKKLGIKQKLIWVTTIVIATFPAIMVIIILNFILSFENENFANKVKLLQEKEVKIVQPINAKVIGEKIKSEDPIFLDKGYHLNSTYLYNEKTFYDPSVLKYVEVEYSEGYKDTISVFKGYAYVVDSDTEHTHFSFVYLTEEEAAELELKAGEYLHTVHLAK